jgi:cytochrome c553
MKIAMKIVLLTAICAMVAMAQPTSITNLTTDVLGAHNVYGRGCVACHAPHSGPAGNGVPKGVGANVALWGQDLSPLFGQTLSFGDNGKYTVTLPANSAAITSASDPATVIIFCLSCHDGNLAKPGMMKGVTVETLPVVGGNAPTFLGNDGSGAGNYENDHPVGPLATIGCGGQYNWDCTISATGKIQMTGTASAAFVLNYGQTVSPAVIANVPTVTCTTCHDQHSETIYAGKIANVQGYYQTMFFVRGYYNPVVGGNSVAQFCRNCHGGESNEMHGQLSVPTI